jgi:hypothetical protein
MSNACARPPRGRRSAILVAAVGLALFAAPSSAWAGTASAQPSQNGGGAAVGKPCDGCVGKADDKAPPGQVLDGSDLNAGYECDTNRGVGPGNPAHTGCGGGTT